MATAAKEHMEFRRIGGSYQMTVRSADDLRALLGLDEAHWAINSIDIDSMRTDRRFLEFLDDDSNNQIRADEVKRAVGWFLTVLRDFSGFKTGSDTLEFTAIDDSTPEGANLLEGARLVLENLGEESAGSISLEQLRNQKQILSCARQNGDGVLPPDSADSPETVELIQSAMKLFGSVKDLSGADGIDSAILDKFVAAASAFLCWSDEPEKDPETFRPFGTDTVGYYGRYAAAATAIDDFFVASEALVFCTSFPQHEPGPDPMDAKAVRDFFSGAPAAEPRADEVLDFAGKLNPLKRDALLAFSGDPHTAAFLFNGKLTLESWRKLKGILTPCGDWLGRKPGALFDDFDLTTLRRILKPETVQSLRELIADDLTVAPRLNYCESLLKLLLFQKYLLEFLNNYVCLNRLFNPAEPAMLQAGKLVMDGRCFTLTTIVKNIAEHKTIATLSDICVVYLDATTGKPGALRTMKLAAAVTSGNIRNLFIGKRGIFFTSDGELWDAKVIDLIQQPVSVSEALRMPFYKFGEFMGKQADRFFSAKSQEAQKNLEQDFTAAATKQPTQTPAISGSMMLMGGGIGIAALGSSIAFIVKSLSNVSVFNVLAVMLGIILVFGGPVVAISIVKLYRRNVSRFLEANACAVNLPMRLSRKMGAIFTFTPPIPRSSYIKRDLVDLFQRPAPKNWTLRIILMLLILLLLGMAGYWCYLRYFAPIPVKHAATETIAEKPTPPAEGNKHP